MSQRYAHSTAFDQVAARRWPRSMVAPVVLLLLLAVAGCGQPAEPPQPAAHTLLTGVVARDDSPVEGAEIVVWAWPHQDLLAELGEGDVVPLAELARVETVAAGYFAVALDPADVGPDHTGADGQVDIELAATDGGSELRWQFTATPASEEQRRATGYTWGTPRVDPALLNDRRVEAKGPVHVLVDLGAETVIEEGDDPADWAE